MTSEAATLASSDLSESVAQMVPLSTKMSCGRPGRSIVAMISRLPLQGIVPNPVVTISDGWAPDP